MAITDTASLTEPQSIWLYTPSLPLSIVFAIIYFIPTAILSYQTLIKYRARYFIVVVFGSILEVAGYIVRAIACKHLSQIPPFAVQAFIVLAPLFIGAGNYLLIYRLCLRVLPASRTHIFHIPVRHLTRIFVLCDIMSFLIQVSGIGIATSQSWAGVTLTIGENTLITGLCTQVATFLFFIAIVVRFHRLTKREHGVRSDAGEGWRNVLKAVYISSALIVIRSVYRMIEFSLGVFGYPFTHEWIFFVFESVPMVPAIAVFCVWFPAEYFSSERKEGTEADIRFEEPNEGSRV